MIGCSNDRSRTQFIIFHDDMSYTLRHTVQIRSLAAYLLDITRSQDAFTICDTLVDFVSTYLHVIQEGPMNRNK